MALTQVSTSGIKDATIATADIAAAAVTEAKIASAAVTGAKIAADAITGALIADDAVGSEHIEVLDDNLVLLKSTGTASIKIGSGNAAGAQIFLDGDSNGDVSGSDYCYIEHNSDGDLVLGANNPAGDANCHIKVGASDEYQARFTAGGSAELRYANNKKFETAADGIEISNAANSKVEQKFHYGSNSSYALITMDSSNNLILNTDAGAASSDSFIGFNVDNSEHMRVDSNGFLTINRNSAVTTDSNRLLQVVGDTNGGGIIVLARDDTALSNETIGGIEFFGNDPGSAYTRTAGIYCEAAANWSSSDYPSQMVFKTTVDGSASTSRKLELGHNYVQTNSTVYFNSADNSEPLASFVEGGTCKLYYDGGSYAKLETITDGVKIGGSGYAGFHRLDSTAYHIGQNSDNRDLRLYSGDDEHNDLDAGVRLEVAQTTWSAFSDERLKENITDIGSVLTKIKDIRCITYTRKNKTKAPETLGFIAQDFVGKFDQVLGEGVVSESDSTKYYSIRYTETIPILLKAIQELSAKVTALEAK